MDGRLKIMEVNKNIKGDAAGFEALREGMIVTVDAYKHDDDDLNDYMDEHDDGYGQIVSSFDDETGLVWVVGCPYAIPSWIVFRDQDTEMLPNGKEVLEKDN